MPSSMAFPHGFAEFLLLNSVICHYSGNQSIVRNTTSEYEIRSAGRNGKVFDKMYIISFMVIRVIDTILVENFGTFFNSCLSVKLLSP